MGNTDLGKIRQNKKEEKIGKGGKCGKRGKRVDPCLYNHHPHQLLK